MRSTDERWPPPKLIAIRQFFETTFRRATEHRIQHAEGNIFFVSHAALTVQFLTCDTDELIEKLLPEIYGLGSP